MRKMFCLSAVVVIAAILCGCNPFTVTPDELLSPPQLSGDMYPIQKALDESAEKGYTLKYPSSGDRRSAIVLEDIDSNGTLEAFAFYSTVDEDLTTMHVNFIAQENGEWKSADTQSITAGGIERVDFCDLDGDGVKEILIGWEIYGSSEKQLAVYSCSAKALSQRLLQQYTTFICCDLDGNGEQNLFVQFLDTSQGTNAASVYNIDENGVSKTAGCLMDKTVKTVNQPVVSTISTGQNAIYVDEIKGIGAVTEVLYISKGELVNPLLDTEKTENTKTLRAATLSCTDINLDGILEIPVASDLPNAAGGTEKLYYTRWSVFNGEKLTEKQVSIINTVDGYSIDLPKKLIGSIAVLKDSDKRTRTVYEYNGEEQRIGKKLVSFRAMTVREYKEEKKNKTDMTELVQRDGTVIVGMLYEADSPIAISAEELKNMIK